MSDDRHVLPGWTAIHSRDVALPVFRLKADVLANLEQVLPSLSEFVLRAVGAGFASPEQVSAVLGLSGDDVEAVLVELIGEHLLSLTSSDAEERSDELLTITHQGARLLQGGQLMRTEEVRAEFDFDGLLRRPVERRSWLLRPREIRQHGFFEIPAIPNRSPKLLEIDAGEVSTALAVSPGSRALQVLRVARVLRAERVYAPAMMIVYQNKKSGEVRPVFKVADLTQDDHARAFLDGGGMDRLDLGEATTDERERIKKEAASLLLKPIRRVRERANDPGIGPQARLLATYDHPLKLEEALATAKERIIIFSPWLKEAVVSEEFVGKLRNLLRNGVAVYIGWGLGEPALSDDRAVERLIELENEYLAIARVRYFGDSHVKALVCDERFAVVGSFNWLSFQGDPSRPFRDERSYLIQNSDLVQETAVDLLARFEERS